MSNDETSPDPKSLENWLGQPVLPWNYTSGDARPDASPVMVAEESAELITTLALPEINSLINVAFPMWEVDEDGERLNTTECTVETCEWNPFYITKRYDGLHPDFGGHPTDNDVQYAFYASAPFEGQPYPGTPHHCPMNATDDIKAGDCPKIATTSDSDPNGPGHVPPHIALASLTWGVGDKLFEMEEMFDYENFECRVDPDTLFQMVRHYYPRLEGEKVDYPPPITPEGGDFQYEFPSGRGLDKQKPPYEPGPPHWCTEEMLESGHWDGVCPYIFEGPDAGKYRHPHIAYAALEVYLASKAMPDKCAMTWLENNAWFLDEDRVTTDTPFPVMENNDADAKTVENWLGQPVLPWNYTSGDARPDASPVMLAEDSAKLITTLALPEINSLINVAFPMWEVDEDGERVETKNCTVEACEWNPFYVTKRYDGLHPDFGGHPTDNDVQYAFYASAPFEGQPYPGTPHHCPLDAPDNITAGECPKIVTMSDSDPAGPGHVPPHIALASLTWGVEDELFSMEEIFDYDNFECRVDPATLFKMIRNYYPRTEGVAVPYPPPITPEGGDFQYEFPSGGGLENQEPPYAPGPPHWCTDEMLETGHWDGVCPYIFEGPDAGKYRHPHIAYAALEIYLANMAMPDKCAMTWLENNAWFLDEDRVTTDTPFPIMENDDEDPMSVDHWIGQPELPWTYDSGDARPDASPVMLAEDSANAAQTTTTTTTTTTATTTTTTEVRDRPSYDGIILICFFTFANVILVCITFRSLYSCQQRPLMKPK